MANPAREEEVPQPVPAQVVVTNPDPTLRTMQLVDKDLRALRDELETRFQGVNTRFEAMDKASTLLHEDYVRVPTQVDRAVDALKELILQHLDTLKAERVGEINRIEGAMLEKFAGVAAQFSERDTRTDQRAGDTKLAVDAAFAAAKEATGKIEAGFTKQIDAMTAMIDTKTANADGKIMDLKERLTVMESRGAIMDPSVSTALSGLSGDVRMLRESRENVSGHVAATNDYTAMIIAGAGVFISLLASTITIAVLVFRHG